MIEEAENDWLPRDCLLKVCLIQLTVKELKGVCGDKDVEEEIYKTIMDAVKRGREVCNLGTIK